MTRVIGHKGAAALADENRVAAVLAAQATGADGIEFDVRRAHGAHLAVWHDPHLPDGRVLLDTPWDQLAAHLDQLDDILDAAEGLDLVNIEIKNWPTDADYDAEHTIATATVDRLARRPPTEQASYVVSCFDLPTLNTARARLDTITPDIVTGRLIWLIEDIAATVTETIEHGHQALHPHHSGVNPELITAAHAAGLTVNCWTCNDPDRIRWLADIGTDGIITDNPQLARAALNGETL